DADPPGRVHPPRREQHHDDQRGRPCDLRLLRTDMSTLTEPTGTDVVAEAPKPKKRSALQAVMQFELTPKKVKRKELMHFSRQLAVFARAGIPLLDAFDSISSEMSNKFFRSILIDIRQRLVAGTPLSDAVAAHEDAFPDFYIGMLQAAELTGRLDSVLDQLADYIERDLEARQKVMSALLYPAVVMGMSAVTVAVLTLYVLPKFKTLFKSLHAHLPLPTRILLSVADWVGTYWYIVIAVPVVLAIAAWAMISTERGRAARDKLLLGLPAFGVIVQYA